MRRQAINSTFFGPFGAWARFALFQLICLVRRSAKGRDASPRAANFQLFFPGSNMRLNTKITIGLLSVWMVASLTGCGAGTHEKAANQSSRMYEDAKSEASAYSRVITISVDGEDLEGPIAENTEEYREEEENEFKDALLNPQSTFSIDVDTASYSNVRRILRENRLPPAGAVRIEEMVNYFDYDYPQPDGDHPFSVITNVAACPWTSGHQLVRIALKGKELQPNERASSNLVFLLDCSGSMDQPNKLPLVKSAMRLLLQKLDDRDYISIVVYAGGSGQVLPPTSAAKRGTILNALERLRAGGSTNGGQGIQLAYKIAQEQFIEGGINRVILCTDGDFNVGLKSQRELEDLIAEKAKSNVFLSVLGFGTGNYKDARMETLADKGNGNFAYIDSVLEAQKSLVNQMESTLVTIAKDVKIQVDFNPSRICAYRLIGYENRMLANEDFEDDTKDAGEIGAGHTVTALYEVVPVGVSNPARQSRPSAFVKTKVRRNADPDTLLNVLLRYKLPESSTSSEFGMSLAQERDSNDYDFSSDFQFAAAVAAYGMILKSSQFKGEATLDWVLESAVENQGHDPYGFRAEFVDLVRRASALKGGLKTSARK